MDNYWTKLASHPTRKKIRSFGKVMSYYMANESRILLIAWMNNEDRNHVYRAKFASACFDVGDWICDIYIDGMHWYEPYTPDARQISAHESFFDEGWISENILQPVR